MEYCEEDYLPLSGIQHFEFCQRQWGLIHVEKAWKENLLTIEGGFMHEKAHESSREKRSELVIVRNMPVFSRIIGMSGACDVVEFVEHPDGVNLHGRDGHFLPIPIEYKRGKPKDNDSDVLQLCAQAMCIEEMLVCRVEKGYMFYGETKRRMSVDFDARLREKVNESFKMMHAYYQRGYTPKAKYSKKCNACSLIDLCMPKLAKAKSAREYYILRTMECDL